MSLCVREVIDTEQYLSTSDSAHLSVTESSASSAGVIYSLIHCLRGSLIPLLTHSVCSMCWAWAYVMSGHQRKWMENWQSLMPHLLKLINVMGNRLSFLNALSFSFEMTLKHLQADESPMQWMLCCKSRFHYLSSIMEIGVNSRRCGGSMFFKILYIW